MKGEQTKLNRIPLPSSHNMFSIRQITKQTQSNLHYVMLFPSLFTSVFVFVEREHLFVSRSIGKHIVDVDLGRI